jgi:MFS family permease
MHDASRRHALTVGLLFRDIRDGLRFLVRHDGVRTMTMVGFLQCVSLGGFMSLTVVWLDRVLGLGTEGWRFGVTYGAWAVGGLAASLALPRLLRRVTPARITLATLPFAAALGVLVSRLQTWWVVAALMVVWALAATLVMINSITYRQQVTPEHLLGRVNTAGRMLSWGVGWTGGALLAGVLVGQLGLRTTMSAFACVNLLGVVVAWTSPLRRTADERPIWNEIPDSETVP